MLERGTVCTHRLIMQEARFNLRGAFSRAVSVIFFICFNEHAYAFVPLVEIKSVTKLNSDSKLLVLIIQVLENSEISVSIREGGGRLQFCTMRSFFSVIIDLKCNRLVRYRI